MMGWEVKVMSGEYATILSGILSMFGGAGGGVV